MTRRGPDARRRERQAEPYRRPPPDPPTGSTSGGPPGDATGHEPEHAAPQIACLSRSIADLHNRRAAFEAQLGAAS